MVDVYATYNGVRSEFHTVLHVNFQITESNGETSLGGQPSKAKLELSFEYLMAKDTLKWITITTDQVIEYNYW